MIVIAAATRPRVCRKSILPVPPLYPALYRAITMKILHLSATEFVSLALALSNRFHDPIVASTARIPCARSHAYARGYTHTALQLRAVSRSAPSAQ